MVLSTPFAILLLLAPLRGAAQVASPSWRKPNITTSATERVSLADAALQLAITSLNSGAQFNGESYGIAGALYSQMAEFDLATNQTKYEKYLEQYFPLAQQTRANFSDELSYGYAAARAYAAYKNPTFLQYAIESWWFGRAWTLSQDDVSSGTFAEKEFPIENVCQESELSNYSLRNLSALLAEATPDPMYLQAATESAEFIHAHLYNVQNVVQDSISARANDSCSASSIVGPYNSGLMIEGLAILSSINRNNASTQNLLNDILLAAIPNSAWQTDNGIIGGNGRNSGDLNLVRGLGAVYARNTTTPALRAYINAYISVQFNAVIDLATSGATNIYAASWTGPPSKKFLGGNQTQALGALISALSIGNDSAPSQSSATPTPSSSSSSSPSPSSTAVPTRKPPLGPIIGGVVGGVALLAVGFIIWLVRRRHFYSSVQQTPRPTSIVLSSSVTSWIQPFTAPTHSRRAKNKIGEPEFEESSRKPRNQPSSSREGPAQSSAKTAMNGAPSRRPPVVEQRPSPPSDTPNSAALPTEELVRLLNDRLRNHEWDEAEAPPEYPTSHP
ncbi:hypothetical protein FB451DRAFT_1255438 [Mycena latifolia]|nr:hypothetical protein FB451DRAFT_1255438 [Mycena latifolia]